MDEKQMTKGREAYQMMDEACNQLVKSGNWQRVGSSDIKLFLDMYVQALLLKMAQTTGEISEAMLTYIASVPARDILNIGKASAQQALNIGFKNRSFAEGTPLLLRCCVAMDDKDGTATAQQFVDGVSRLLYAAADVDGDMSGNELNFITAYAGGLRTFLMTRAAGRHYNGAQEAARRVDIPGENQPKVGNEKTNPTNEKQPETKPEEKEETLDELMEQLDSLIGLDTVKHEVRSLINLIKVRAMRKEHDLKVMNMSFHMVFTGNPGTGKTTVARLVAKIYKQLGFLSKGQLIETDRSGLVAGYVGQTAGKVTDVVNSALGGILFIDEAYALARKGMDNDFGHEAIDTLVKLMEDHRDDLVVIGAGNSAMDVARTALRKGVRRVNVFCRRYQTAASVREVDYAKADGVEFFYGMRPTRIVDDGVYYKKVEMNEEGNITSTSEEQFFPCSSVIIAISQGAQSRIVSTTTGLEISSHGLLATNEHGETTREGIFASGDVVLGARTVVEAVKYSKQVADEMDAYLRRRREAKQEDNA